MADTVYPFFARFPEPPGKPGLDPANPANGCVLYARHDIEARNWLFHIWEKLLGLDGKVGLPDIVFSDIGGHLPTRRGGFSKEVEEIGYYASGRSSGGSGKLGSLMRDWYTIQNAIGSDLHYYVFADKTDVNYQKDQLDHNDGAVRKVKIWGHGVEKVDELTIDTPFIGDVKFGGSYRRKIKDEVFQGVWVVELSNVPSGLDLPEVIVVPASADWEAEARAKAWLSIWHNGPALMGPGDGTERSLTDIENDVDANWSAITKTTRELQANEFFLFD